PHTHLRPSPTASVVPLSFSFTDTPPTEIYTLSLHDALPILVERLRHADLLVRARDVGVAGRALFVVDVSGSGGGEQDREDEFHGDRKSTRLTPVTFRSRMPSSA